MIHSALKVRLLVAAVMTCAGLSASAQTTIWTNTGTGNWDTAANWSAGLPALGGNAQINNGGTAQLSTLYNPVLQDLILANSAGSSGSLDILSGGDFLGNRIIVGNAGTGTATVTDGVLSTATGASIYVGSYDVTTGVGTMDVNDGGVVIAGDDFISGRQGSGDLTFHAGSSGAGLFTVVAKYGTGVWNQEGGVYNQRGGDLEIGDGGNPSQLAGNPGPRQGTLNISGGAFRVWGAISIGNRIGTGELNISGGGLVTSGGGVGNNNLIVGLGKDWSAQQLIDNNISGQSATMRVIGDDSVIAVANDFRMNPNGTYDDAATLIATITGPTHTPILVGRNAEISTGIFAVELDGYSPVAGDQWSILQTNVDLSDAYTAFDATATAEDVQLYDTSGNEQTLEEAFVHNNTRFETNPTDENYVGVSGPFASVDFSAASLGAGLEFQLEYLQDEVLLKVVSVAGGLSGDFNNDGVVNLADYTVWRNNLGGTFDLAGNGDESGGSAGVVDVADYELWKSNFGVMAPGGAISTAAVPEPAAVLTMLGMTVMLTAGIRRRRQLG